MKKKQQKRGVTKKGKGQKIWINTKYKGVRYKEHPTRKYKGQPDKYFEIRIRHEGQSVSRGLGWASEGMTLTKARRYLDELKKRLEEEAQLEKNLLDRQKVTLEECFQHYIKWAKVNKKSWKEDEMRYKKMIRPFFGPDTPMIKITPKKIERFKQELIRQKYAPATIVQFLAILRILFNKARVWFDLPVDNPVSKVKMPTINNQRTRFLSREEAKTLLKALKSKKSLLAYDMAVLSLYTGMRRGEIWNLTFGDIDFENGIIHIRDSKSGYGRKAFILPKVEEVLIRRRENAIEQGNYSPGGYVFSSRKGEKIKYMTSAFKRTVEKLGFNDGIEDARFKVTFHTLRHTFASWLAMKGVPLYQIKELMGHKTFAMTERYAHLSPDSNRKAAMKILEDD